VVTQALTEQAQLELIKLEYESRGYEVSFTERHRIQGRTFIPDAIARRRPRPDEPARPGDEETIVIELVNSSKSGRDRDSRTDFLAAIFAEEPSWKLDIRYIDNPSLVEDRATLGVEQSWNLSEGIVQGRPSRSLKDLKTRKRAIGKPTSVAPEYLRIWSYLTQTLRFWERRFYRQGYSQSPLSTIWLAFVEGPGQRIQEKGLQPDFPQFEDYAQIALQGGILDKERVAQIWTFYLAVHRAVSSIRVE
jgi:hypothetical protein